MLASLKKIESDFPGWLKRRRHWGGRQDSTFETLVTFLYMPFTRFNETVAYEGRFPSFMTHLYANSVILEVVYLDACCGGSNLGEVRFVDNHAY